MDKHNRIVISGLMRLGTLTFIFVTNCKATMPKTGFLGYEDRYPNAQALVAANFSLFTTAKDLKKPKPYALASTLQTRVAL